MSDRPLMVFNSGKGAATTPKTWEEIALGLFSLLDDIDTAGDMFKPQWQGYEQYVQAKADARFLFAVSDGQDVAFNVHSGERDT